MSSQIHDTSEYGLPSPDSRDENARLEIQHRLWLTSLSALYLAPIATVPQSPHLVLDIGCGPGLWTRDFALKHPTSQVVGLDLSPPKVAAMPTNTAFIKGNAEDTSSLRSTVPANSAGFTFIFGRCLTLGIHDWHAHLSRCYSILAPGGWLESAETRFLWETADLPAAEDGSLVRSASAVCRWMEYLVAGTRVLGFDPELANPGHLDSALKQAGFENISEKSDIWWPFGGSEEYPWEIERDREMAEFGREDFFAFFRATTERVLPAAEGCDSEKARALLEDVWKEVEGPSCRRYWIRFAVRIGQKPSS